MWGRILSVVAATCALGCAADGARPVRLPGGETGLELECWHDESVCEARADEHCPIGYELVTWTERDARSGSSRRDRTLYRYTIRCWD